MFSPRYYVDPLLERKSNKTGECFARLAAFSFQKHWECLLVVLRSDLFKHGKVDEEIAALAESRGHSFVKSCYLDAHTMIGAVVEHRHEVAIPADQHDTVNRSTIHKTHNIHTQVQVEIGLFRTTGESFIVLRSDTIAQTFDCL